ncbi:PREDICTED: metacaspase-9 [Theobroma cacao]|uniref:Metacaspase-9 n=1 Tax=Theobroma cacao TaxID=3641 RepID=A0AB32UMR1_THECC|nr:PREDICTED: metacaspase-9 [Theobroma cacao]
MDKGKKRLAVLVGCNYANTQHELHGCINDVVAMREVLVERFGFDPSHIELLTDAPGSLVMPTGANIKASLNEMMNKAEAGDVLFFHYSGHGTRIPSLKPGHHFRQDEAIVPCDFNLITDVDFRQLVNRLPRGATFTILSDSCHSGGLIDKEKEQIGPSIVKNTTSVSYTVKTIPFQSVLRHLSSLTSINTSDIGTHLLEFFGADASLKFRLPKLESDLLESLKTDEGILLSGCQADETSADMNAIEGGGKAYGVFSNAVHMALNENSGALSNRKVVMMARRVLEAQGFAQHPCLYCSDGNADATFLLQPEAN